tara:strand:+ start:11932 stop:13539 length:1608 start_codon:yes stop_codon:yes gene_type:complete
MGKEVKFGAEARGGLQEGLDILANAVKSTLGPKGRHAAIDTSYGAPLVTKDGVTVARSISLDDKLQNMGAQLIKTVASATNAVAGDGTTTATVLAQSIYTEGAKMVAAGHNPVLIKRGIDKAVSSVVDTLKDMSVPVTSEDVIKSVAIISSNNDISLGEMIGDVVSSVGNDGTISVEDAAGTETRVEYTEGLTIDRGYIVPTFITNFEKLTVEFESSLVLIYDGVMSSSYDLLPMLDAVSKAGRPLLIIAKNVDAEALQTLVLNKARGAISVCAIRAPGFGDVRNELLGDIAVMCGGRLYNENELGLIRNANLDDLGEARRVIVSRNSTTIIDGAGTQDDVELRVKSIKSQLNQTDLYDHQIASLRQRLSTVSGSVAVFKVGGVSEAEMKERKDRVEDAINAVKAAIEEGIVPGGGSALLHCSKTLQSLKTTKGLIEEERVGIAIVERAIREPFIQILKNAGVDHYSFMEKIISSSSKMVGYDAFNNVLSKDMMKSGVIDPVKVVRTALENAASASGTLLTTEVTIHDLDKKTDS